MLNTTLPAGSVPGIWGLSSVQLQDRANNFKNYSFVEYVAFDVIESSVELSQPLVVSISDHAVNASNVESIDIDISCSPCRDLKYNYSIYSDGGGNVNTGSGTFDSDTVRIRNLNLINVEDGNLNVTVQLTDQSDQLITTTTARSIKDTVVPIDYGYFVTLSDTGLTNAQHMQLDLFFAETDSNGVYRFELLPQSAGQKVKQEWRSDALIFQDTIRSTSARLTNIDFSTLQDGKIQSQFYVIDQAGNQGQVQAAYFDKLGEQLRKVDSLYVELTSPVHRAILADPRPRLSWSAVQGPNTQYYIQIAESPDFDQIIEEASVHGSSYQLTTALESGKSWYWRVQALQEGQVGNWSLIRAFERQAAALPTTVVQHRINQGWNLVGLSVRKAHDNAREVFPSMQANSMFAYEGSYVGINQMQYGKGYWMRSTQSQNTQLEGERIDSLSIYLSEGWNLVAGPSETFAANAISDTSSILLPGTLFGYNQGYAISDSIYPNQGYWLRARESGYITLVQSTVQKSPMAQSTAIDLSSFVELRLSDEQQQTTLFFDGTQADVNLSGAFTLPPAAPTLWDARFSQDKWLLNATEAELLLSNLPENGVELKLSLPEERLEDEASRPYHIAIFSNEQLLQEYTIYHDEAIQLASGIDKVALVKGQLTSFQNEDLPTEMELAQNYPNPFNPLTQIQYALPEASNVRLEVFNSQGQRVARLVDSQQAAGRYTVAFDASGLSSGVYFYKIQTNLGQISRKMVVIK